MRTTFQWKIFDNRCWWCKSTDLSEEHKYKRTDLEREYFKDPSIKKVLLCSLSHISESGKIIQGPKSKNLKFKASLCQYCNNSRSQSYDIAYDKLVIYLKTNESSILKLPSIQLVDIYGEEFKDQVHNLFKYFVKHLCCTLVDSNIGIPQNLLDYLNGNSNLKHVELIVSQSIDRKHYLDEVVKEISTASWIGCSDVQVYFSKSTKAIFFIRYELYYRSFSFYINLDTSIEGFKTNFGPDSINLILYNEEAFKDLNLKTNSSSI